MWHDIFGALIFMAVIVLLFSAEPVGRHFRDN